MDLGPYPFRRNRRHMHDDGQRGVFLNGARDLRDGTNGCLVWLFRIRYLGKGETPMTTDIINAFLFAGSLALGGWLCTRKYK